MTNVATRRAEFKARLKQGEFIVAPGGHNGLVAKIIERAGFPAVYMSGAGVANTLFGLPDVGLITLTEMTFVSFDPAFSVSVTICPP